MRVMVRSTIPRARSGLSFAVSGCVHGCVLAWVIWGGTGQPRERAQSIYDREIRPNEKRIVWYSLREKLPEITPADTEADARRTQRVPRARVVAEVKTAVELPVAAPSGPRRAFTPPPNVRMQRQAMVQLPEGPQPEMVVEPDALPFPGAGPRPEPKAFVAPPTKSRPVTAVGLPAAPEAAGMRVKLRSLTVAALIGQPAMPGAAPGIPVEPPVAAGVAGVTAEASLAIVGLNPAKTTEVP